MYWFIFVLFGLEYVWFKHVSAQAHQQHRQCTLLCIVGVCGCAVATRVSEPPRGCRWETDTHVVIGLRMLTRPTHDRWSSVYVRWACAQWVLVDCECIVHM